MSYVISRPWGGHCGVGHQFYNWVVAWQLANYYDLKFVHAPIIGTSPSQGYNDFTDKRWEQFLNLGHSEIIESQLPCDIRKIKLPELPWKEDLWIHHTCDNELWARIIKEHKNDNVLFECARNQFMRLDQSCLQHHRLRAKYWEARQKYPMPCMFDTTKLNVAIHIRRGDITPNSNAKDRWMNMAIYTNIIYQIRNLDGNNAIFHIYSDGTRKDLAELIDLPNIVLHLQEDVFDTFHHMVMADVLVIGKSSFSALAGHLQNKVKIVQSWSSINDTPKSLKRSVGPFIWENFPDHEYFVPMNDTGQIDIDLLRVQLSEVGS